MLAVSVVYRFEVAVRNVLFSVTEISPIMCTIKKIRQAQTGPDRLGLTLDRPRQAHIGITQPRQAQIGTKQAQTGPDWHQICTDMFRLAP